MAEHHLKCWKPYYDAVARGEKNFEVRRNDRGFQLGDTLTLHEWDPKLGGYTGPFCSRRISYVLTGGQFGIEAGYVVLGLANA